jgi:hypothetical protein
VAAVLGGDRHRRSSPAASLRSAGRSGQGRLELARGHPATLCAQDRAFMKALDELLEPPP